MKKLIVILLALILIIYSCKNEEYEKIKNYENKIKKLLIEDMDKIQASIEYELEGLEDGKEDIPVKYKSWFNTMNQLNNLCLKFYKSSLKSKDLIKINESIINLKKEIVNLDMLWNNKPNLKKITEIKNEIDKYQINKELKALVLYLLKNDGSASYEIGHCGGPSPPNVMPIRLNDSTIIININKSDRPNLLKIREIKDYKTQKNIEFYPQNRNLQSYTITTKSDTLKFRASFKHNGNYPSLSKLDTTMVVNNRYYFKIVALKDYSFN